MKVIPMTRWGLDAGRATISLWQWVQLLRPENFGRLALRCTGLNIGALTRAGGRLEYRKGRALREGRGMAERGLSHGQGGCPFPTAPAPASEYHEQTHQPQQDGCDGFQMGGQIGPSL